MKAKMVAKLILLATMAAVGLLPDESNASETTPAVDPFIGCVRILSFDIQFEALSKKLPLYDMTTITFAMLADNSFATPQERKDLLAWFDKRDRCWKDSEALHQSQWPPDIFQLSQEGNAAIHKIGLNLYNRKINFGEANQEIQDQGNAIKTRLLAVVKWYQDEIAAQKAVADQQAEQKREASAQLAAQQQANYQAQAQADATQDQAVRQQRAQMFLNYMNTMQQQQQQLREQQLQQLAPRPSYTTNCFTAGSNTNCTTR
jgi:hypothetical protein